MKEKNFYAGIIYFRVFSDKDEDIIQIDTNAFDKSILYFYTSLLYNIKGADCHQLDYKINNEKSIIIVLLKNPKIEYWDDHHKFEILDYYLPKIEDYIKEHKISEDSNEILEILRAFKE